MDIISDSNLASWLRMEMTFPSPMSDNTSVRLTPSINCMNIYSVSAALSDVGEYPYTSGMGSPLERRKAIVATSLAMAKYFGAVVEYGIRATIRKPSRMVMRKTRLKPPSANFLRLSMSSGLRLTDSAARRRSPSILNSRLRSARRDSSLTLNTN